MYINGYQSGLINYPSEVSNTVGILLTRWFYYSGDLTVARMQLVFTLGGLSFCRFTDGTSWTPWSSTGVGILSDLTTTDKSSAVAAINEVNSAVNTLNRGGIFYYPVVSVNNIAAMTLPKANSYTITSISLFGGQIIPEATEGVTDGYIIGWRSAAEGYLVLKLVGSFANVNVGNILSVFVEIR